MAFFAVPRLRKILDIRQLRIDTLLNVANKFNEKSEKIKKEAEDLLAKTKQDILKTEEELISELEQKSAEEKQKLSKMQKGSRNYTKQRNGFAENFVRGGI